ncbi:hypothetical protein HRbin22_02448 [Candidatus Thermoflexus japonica]|uniref:Uncharacterized protein n=1 Tax=Candidatus Thermoflexus japonica TaxID=2035417 RepID=A0A2H5Y9T8_9CHLR|nr:hypothetical protein HRbin22_02448 [Candidatus Thermoflexus japonica]
MVPLELIYLFAGGALIVGLLFGLALGLALRGGRGPQSGSAPPPPRTETGIALVRAPDGTWWIEVGKQRYRHLREIHDHQAAMLVLEALRAIRGMTESSAALPLPAPGISSSVPALAEQLDAILQELLQRHPELPYRAVRFETLPDGTLGITVGGQRYGRPEEVPDPNLRALLQEVIRRWSEGGKPMQ